MLDRRLNAYRPDLADEALQGVVEAARFVVGTPARIAGSIADMRPRPELAVGIDTQLLRGEAVVVFERADGWAWVRASQDGYVGYIPEAVLEASSPAPTHRIVQPRSFVYSGPDMRFPRVEALSMGSRVSAVGEAETRGTRYLLLADGSAVVASHCLPESQNVAGDYVSVAARLIETPYLWGGKSAFGIDCSGLVQMAMLMVGMTAPRDSDMQAADLGVEIEQGHLRRGDLVFWKGHVAIMEDGETMIHANGHTMSVARERLDDAIERIGYLYNRPTRFRRP